MIIISSTGVRKRRTPEDRINDAIDGVADAYLRKARRYSDKAFSQGSALGTGPIYGSINPGTNSLQTSGGAMIGSIAFNPITVAVDDGRINIEPDQNEASKASSYALVTGQGSPDDLLFIDGADKNGQYLILQGTATQILVLKAATIAGIANISGLGTVTVVTTSDHNMLTGAKANIIGTDNFNISNVTVIRINATEFTYSATGSIFPETAGIVQNGNIVTPDGNDVILDATVALNGVPIATLIFDPTVAGFGAWRIVSVSIVSGTAGDFLRVSGGAMFGPIAYDPDFVFVDSDGRVPITSSYIQSTGIGSPDDVFFFDGALFNGQQLEYQVANGTIQIIKNAVLKNASSIVGNNTDTNITVTIDDTSQLATNDKVNIFGTTNFDINNVSIIVTTGTEFTYDLGSIGDPNAETGGVQRGNIVMPDDQDLTLDSNISTLGVAIATFVFDPTILGTGWRLASSTVGGDGGDVTLPIRFPVTTGLPTTGNVTLNLNQESGHYFTIGPLTGNIDIDIINPPPADTAQAFRINIIKGATDFTVTFNDTLLVQPFIGTENTTTLLAGDIYDGSVFNIFTMTSTAGSGSPTELWANFPAVNDVNFATFDGINVDRLLFDQAAGETLLATDTGITSNANGNLLFNSLDEHIFSVDGNDVAKFEDAGAGVLELDMLDHAINSVKDISFDETTEFAGAGAIPTIGFDNSDAELLYNVPNNAKHVWTENNIELMGLTASQLTFADGLKIQGNPNATNPGLSVGQFAGDPAGLTNADIWYNSTTNKLNARINDATVDLGGASSVVFADDVFRIQDDGDATKQIAFQASGITTGTTRTITMPDADLTLVSNTLNNLGTTSINAALLPEDLATLDLGSELLPWRIGHFREIEFPVTSASAPIATTDNQISRYETGTGVNLLNHFYSHILKPVGSNLPGQFEWIFNGAVGAILSRSGTTDEFRTDIINVNSHIQLQNQSVVPLVDGILTMVSSGIVTLHETEFQIRRGATGNEFNEFSLVKVDAAPSDSEPIADINFQLFDTSIITYAKVQGGILDVADAGSLSLRVRANNQTTLALGLQLTGDDNVTGRSYLNVFARINSGLRFGFDGAGSLAAKIQPLSASTVLGIVVQDNATFAVGSLGTLAIPTSATLPTTDLQADGFFGNHKGSLGMFDNGSSTLVLFYRDVDGRWASSAGWTRDILTPT